MRQLFCISLALVTFKLFISVLGDKVAKPISFRTIIGESSRVLSAKNPK